jgi:hypothetical protein
MYPESIEYFKRLWETFSINKLRKQLGVLQNQQAWDAVRLIKLVIREKKNQNKNKKING